MLQNGHTCACGHKYGSLGPSTECHSVCKGSSISGLCGGKSATSVFKTDEGQCLFDLIT